MLTFTVLIEGQPVRSLDCACAFLVGTDDVPLRAEFSLHDGVLTCRKRAAGPAGLVLPWTVSGIGHFLLETARIVERGRPYVLQLELVRGRLIRLFQKVEEWGLHELEMASNFTLRQNRSRELLLNGMIAETPAASASWGDQALAACVSLSEDITAAHSQALLERRRAARAVPRQWLGCSTEATPSATAGRDAIAETLDFVALPMTWKSIEPDEQKPDFSLVDDWVQWAARKKLALRAAPLLTTDPEHLPEWIKAYEDDFDALRDLAQEHVKRVVSRYAPRVATWVAVSGLNVGRELPLSFEQIMEWTRMSAAVVKRLSPSATVLIEIDQPWGEYYASNPRSVPPALYAEMVTQGGIPFDGFALKLRCAGGLRDFFQISALLDRFSSFSKPLHVTACGAPSSPCPEQPGVWHSPWDDAVAAEWLQRLVEVCLGRPFVESVCCGRWLDSGDTSGLCTAAGKTKPALRAMSGMRSRLNGPAK